VVDGRVAPGIGAGGKQCNDQSWRLGWFISSHLTAVPSEVPRLRLASIDPDTHRPLESVASEEPGKPQVQEGTGKEAKPKLPIFSVLGSIDFSDHFLIVGDVGTGKSTVTPIHEFEIYKRNRQIIIREPSRAACNALFYSLQALHPEIKDELAVITKDTKINVGGRIKIVTDGVLLRMLAENSVVDSSIYFDESHQMSSQLELCLSLAKKEEARAGNLFRVMSATIDPKEFLSFLGISKLYTLSGREYPVAIEVEMAKDFEEMFRILSLYLYQQANNQSWLVFLPTRRLVERYASNYGGVFIHGGLEGSEINKIQQRAEVEKNLRIFATNVIASSVNIYVDNVLIFNEVIDGKDKLGQKTLQYKKIDNNSLLQMIGRIGRFKPGRAVIISDTPFPKKINSIPVRKALETETPFDLVLLMSKYGLKLSELEFMSKVDPREVAFAEDWLIGIGAIDRQTRKITRKGVLMSEIPYDPDFAHMISGALISGDYDAARFLLASGAFGDSLNHAYKSEMEGPARQFLYGLDKSNELNIKAHLLKGYSEDVEGAFASRLLSNGIFVGFVEEAWKNYEAARETLNDLLLSSEKEPLPKEVLTNLNVFKLRPYLEDCLSFERFELYEKKEHNLREMIIEGPFFARTLTINYRRFLFDTVAMNPSKKYHHRRKR
jgi:HrpA-like RNA helicase